VLLLDARRPLARGRYRLTLTVRPAGGKARNIRRTVIL
jgi:hypothetical protein